VVVRVGGSRPIHTDARVIASTNQNLAKMVRERRFREDLFFRLNVVTLELPPLRERGEDMLLLANFFAAKMAMECSLSDLPVLSETVKQRLMSYDWPGNVRELKNVIERAVYRSCSPLIESIVLDPFDNPYDLEKRREKPVVVVPQENTVPAPSRGWESAPLERFESVREEVDIAFISRALAEHAQNQKEAAQALGLSYDQFRGLFRKYRERLQ